jgi:hypothetical protein
MGRSNPAFGRRDRIDVNRVEITVEPVQKRRSNGSPDLVRELGRAGSRGRKWFGRVPKLPQPPSARRNSVDDTVQNGSPEPGSRRSFSK